jgi:hypothetical protein
MRIQLPWRHDATSHAEPHAEPGRPHVFVQVNDPGLAAMASGGGSRSTGGFGMVTSVAVTDNYIRKSRCGLAGCGRERPDPIHAAPED